MSNLIPQRAGTLKKGAYIQIKGFPCKIANISTSKTGKHGHAKMNITGIDVLTKKKYEELAPTSHNVYVPVITRTEYQVVSAEDGYLSLMDAEGNVKDDIEVPEDEFGEQIKEGLSAGQKDVVVTVLTAPVGAEAASAVLNQIVVDVKLVEP